MFQKIAGTWTETQKITVTTSRPTASDFLHGNFGHSVVLRGDILGVRAPYDFLDGAKGVVYLYRRNDDGQFREVQRISAPEPKSNVGNHGSKLVLMDDFVLVGSHMERKVNVYARTSGGEYLKAAELRASDATDGSNFGFSLHGDGNAVVIGDPYDLNDEETGFIYLFVFEGGAWKEKTKFLRGGTISGDSLMVFPKAFEMNRGRYGGPVEMYDLVCLGG